MKRIIGEPTWHWMARTGATDKEILKHLNIAEVRREAKFWRWKGRVEGMEPPGKAKLARGGAIK
jgi:hypothetical protein